MAVQDSRFSRNMTGDDLSNIMGGVRSTGGIRVSFCYRKTKIRSADAATNGTTETRLCVVKQPIGDRFTVAISEVTPEQAMQRWPREYAAFTQFEELPTDGTPLDELPGVTNSQIGILAINGIRSIEDLLQITEDMAGQLGLDGVRAHRLAAKWEETRKGNAEAIAAADIEARYQTQLDGLIKQGEKTAAYVKQLEAQLSMMQKMQGNTGQQVNTGPMEVNAAGAAADNLEYNVDNMPDPFSEGADIADPRDGAGQERDPDPLLG